MDPHQQASRPGSGSQKVSQIGISGILNGPEDNRDSAYFSANDASSKHTSATSAGGIALLNSAPTYHLSVKDKTPSPTAPMTAIPQPLVSPSSNMSVASMVSPTSPNSADHQRLEAPSHHDADSRRESVDSRMNQNFGDMRLGGPNSPYASHNHSATSIQGTLAQQRNPRPSFDPHSAGNRISNGYAPSADRNPDPLSKTIRTAPAITGPTTGSIARGAEPVKGQAWAFPEDNNPQSGYTDSRRSSIAESIASSQFTTESRLPQGQRRLDDVSGPPPVNRLSTASTDFPSTTHHHSLQHRQLDDLRNEEGGTPSQPYSRTPELRISHKLAERKRRTEMKELFEQLRDLMPQERGAKASKWEILTKAISEHQRQADTIKQWQAHCTKQQGDLDKIRNELHTTRMENERLQVERMQNERPNQGLYPQQPPRANPADNAPLPPQQHYVDGYQQPQQMRPELPPLRSLDNGTGHAPPQPPPESMTGVQYEPPRTNGYRPG